LAFVTRKDCQQFVVEIIHSSAQCSLCHDAGPTNNGKRVD
jgi:hypothetical protein